jgi:hypothetical protein
MYKVDIPMLLYWCECWKLKKQQNWNNVHGTNVFCQSGGGYRMSDHKHNEDIKEELGIAGVYRITIINVKINV